MPRIGSRHLIQVCRRAAVSLNAGVDARTVWQREAELAPWTSRRAFEEISRRASAGDSVADAMADQGNAFPPLVVALVRVGEQTGHLEVVFEQLADHYEYLRQLRREFLMAISWPLLELSVAIIVIAGVIWLPAWLSPHEPIDILGFGLIGTPGLLVYFAVIGGVALLIGAFVFMLSRGWLWTGPLMAVVLKIPLFGACLRTMALSRMAWALATAHNSGMDAVPTMRLALEAAQNSFFLAQSDTVTRWLDDRSEMHEALRRTHAFPEDFVITLQTGELAGSISETMSRLSREYRDRAKALMRAVTVVCTMGVFALVFGLIIFFIIRMALFYVNTINSFLP
jgi:type II secretory pathway component PulF